MLLIGFLKNGNFDFSSLPADLEDAVDVILTNKVSPQLQVLDQTVFDIIKFKYPTNPIVKKVLVLQSLEPQNDGYNTEINESLN